MRVKHQKKSISREELNKEIYLKAPSPEIILDFISELGVSQSQFERFFGVPKGTIRQISYGTHNLPVRFWHIVYEKIVPAYGVGILRDFCISKPVSKNVTISVTNSTIHNPLLDKLKEQLNRPA